MPRVLVWCLEGKMLQAMASKLSSTIFIEGEYLFTLRERGWPVTEDRAIKIQRVSPGSGSLLGMVRILRQLGKDREEGPRLTWLCEPSCKPGESIMTLWHPYTPYSPSYHTGWGSVPSPSLIHIAWGCSNSPIFQKETDLGWLKPSKQQNHDLNAH